MERINISQPDFERDPAVPDGFRAGMVRLGPQLGAQRTGTTVYELAPGEAVCPYHYEYGEEEWLLVLEGHPTVRTPEGIEQVDPLDVMFFPPGPEGAHQVRNDSSEPVRFVMWSTVVLPTASAYPDSGKVGIWTGFEGEDVIVERAAGVDYFHGEPGGAA